MERLWWCFIFVQLSKAGAECETISYLLSAFVLFAAEKKGVIIVCGALIAVLSIV